MKALKKYVVWFRKGIIIDTFAHETSLVPYELGLSVLNTEEHDWFEWDDGDGHDILIVERGSK